MGMSAEVFLMEVGGITVLLQPARGSAAKLSTTTLLHAMAATTSQSRSMSSSICRHIAASGSLP